GFDAVAGKRLLDRIRRGRQEAVALTARAENNPAFERALPLLRLILGIEA
ncbi:MAG: hypothetical protein JF571_10195, partial [Asticcacaulis sp.]|nr:hypothetical protein [Asticcacaulis sp.]